MHLVKKIINFINDVNNNRGYESSLNLFIQNGWYFNIGGQYYNLSIQGLSFLIKTNKKNKRNILIALCAFKRYKNMKGRAAIIYCKLGTMGDIIYVNKNENNVFVRKLGKEIDIDEYLQNRCKLYNKYNLPKIIKINRGMVIFVIN